MRPPDSSRQLNEEQVSLVEQLLEKRRGFIKLCPNYVKRSYRSGGRLGIHTRAVDAPQVSASMPERWIASTVRASHSDAAPMDGLSRIDHPGAVIFLRDALSVRGEQMLGSRMASRFGSNFPVLSKILDPEDPIMFHFHARDEDISRFPQFFSSHQNGKEEAYYFLSAPKGRTPYTHAGLYPGVTKRELLQAIDRGSDDALDLSPAFGQRYGEGFHLPAGIPHRPGTALTLEMQQPSDVFTHLDWFFGGKRLTPQQTHPGFNSMEEALDFIDWAASEDPDILEKHRLTPQLVADTRQRRQGEEFWVFPPAVSRRFSGKRVRVTGCFETIETSAYALFVWQGHGELNGEPIHAGEEFFVSFFAAVKPHRFTCHGKEDLELFKLFPPEL